ncbi:MAG: hypothetical protein VXV93_05830, partial [Pseudomonadota bacterium]|nr:hypothetical protein [Pseudomonadota bacterium]
MTGNQLYVGLFLHLFGNIPVFKRFAMSFSASLIKKFRSDIDGDYRCLDARPLVLVGLMGSG